MLNKLHDALGLRTTPTIFFCSALFIVLFSVLTMILPGPMLGIFGSAADFLMTYLGWFYILGATGFFLFLLYMAVSRFGRVKLGPDDSRPAYSGPVWFTMMFAAGVGSLLMFWGIAEPINHFAVPPRPGVEPGSPEAAMDAIATTDLHLGLFMWAILAVPALCFGYFTYKRKLPPRVSSAFQPLLGDGIHGPIGKAIDVLTLVGSVFGLAVSVGLGALQLNSGLAYQYGVPYSGPLQAVIIAVITAMGLVSLLSGMDKGIKRLSNLNIVMAVAFMIFVLMAGTSMFVLQGTIESIGHFVARLPQMALFNHTFGDSSWLGQWTVFYWAWDICWAPLRGPVHRQDLPGPHHPPVRHRRPGTADAVHHGVGRRLRDELLRHRAQRPRGPRGAGRGRRRHPRRALPLPGELPVAAGDRGGGAAAHPDLLHHHHRLRRPGDGLHRQRPRGRLAQAPARLLGHLHRPDLLLGAAGGGGERADRPAEHHHRHRLPDLHPRLPPGLDDHAGPEGGRRRAAADEDAAVEAGAPGGGVPASCHRRLGLGAGVRHAPGVRRGDRPRVRDADPPDHPDAAGQAAGGCGGTGRVRRRGERPGRCPRGARAGRRGRGRPLRRAEGPRREPVGTAAAHPGQLSDEAPPAAGAAA